MATNSRIGKMLPDGTIKQIYCHWDGYVEGGVGETLVEHYDNEQDINALLALGDLSILARYLYPKGEHSFDKPETHVCVSYSRDRKENEEDTCAKVVSMEEWMTPFYSLGADYYYLFNAGNWLVKDLSDDEGWVLTKKFLPAYILTKEDYDSIIR